MREKNTEDEQQQHWKMLVDATSQTVWQCRSATTVHCRTVRFFVHVLVTLTSL